MTSKNKFKKARNSYCLNVLKGGSKRLRHVFFFDAKMRQELKGKTKEEYDKLFTD